MKKEGNGGLTSVRDTQTQEPGGASEDGQPVADKRKELLKSHQDALKGVEQQASRQYGRYALQAQFSYLISLVTYIFLTFLGIGGFIYSLYFAREAANTSFQQFFCILVFLSSAVLLLILFSNSPIKQIRRSLADLVKINLIYTGFQYHLQKADSAFQQILISELSLDSKEAKAAMKQVKEAINWALESFGNALNELDSDY